MLKKLGTRLDSCDPLLWWLTEVNNSQKQKISQKNNVPADLLPSSGKMSKLKCIAPLEYPSLQYIITLDINAIKCSNKPVFTNFLWQ
jgi:hypothetical protein